MPWKTIAGLAAIALIFIACATIFIPRLGIEADEATPANGIFQRGAPVYSWKLGDNVVPLMLMSYVGATKSWLYNGIFELWKPSALALRFPMVLAGAATLILFFLFLDRAVDRRAAWIGTLLWATDPSFILMEMADFGDVAFQFLFKMGALVALLRFHRTGSRRALAAGFFFLGLGLWDKAVFLWVLFGLGVALLLVFGREMIRDANTPNIGIAAAALIVGALPLIAYNIEHPLRTLRENAHVSAGEPISAKAHILRITMDGSVMAGFMTSYDPGLHPGEPRRWYQRLSLSIADATRHPRHDWMVVILAVAILSLPFLWKTSARAPVLFALTASVATWIPMALTAGAGGAAQHAILLWPFPIMAIGVVISRVPWRALAVAVAAVLAVVNLSVTNQYYADVIRDGGTARWTDAIYPLNDYLRQLPVARIFPADWGITESINLLSEGETPVVATAMTDPIELHNLVSKSQDVFVGRTAAFTFWPDQRARLEAEAKKENLQEETMATIYDRNGRAVFEVFRFRHVHL